MAAIAAAIGLGGWGRETAREIPMPTRHAGLSTDCRRRHNEERRAEAGRELGRIIAARP